MEEVNKYSEMLIDWGITYGTKVLGAIIVFIIGLYVIGWLSGMLGKVMQKRGLESSLQSFLKSIVNVGLKILLLITVAGMLGIETTSFIAIIGALGLAVGLALQGSLANFAGGVLMLIFKPFRVGDLIESQGQTGVVKEIQIFNTILLTPDHKTVILANGAVSNNTIINYSREGTLRVDITVAVAPTNDINKVKSVIENVLMSNPKVLKQPAPGTFIQRMGDGMVTLTIRPYSTVADYWDVYFGVQEEIKVALEQNQIAAPIPTRVIISK